MRIWWKLIRMRRRSVRNGKKYKVMKNEAKLAVTTAKTMTFECLYIELVDKGRESKLCKLAKAR